MSENMFVTGRSFFSPVICDSVLFRISVTMQRFQMSRDILVLLVIACVLRPAAGRFMGLAQMASFRDSEWLMDDPHKAGKLFSRIYIMHKH